MKILKEHEKVILQKAEKSPKLDYIADKIFGIIDKKILKEKKEEKNYIQSYALKELERIKNLDCSKEEKIKKIFDLIHWYYIAISRCFNEEIIKISIPDFFRQAIEDIQIINNKKIIICGDNPGNKEYEEDRGFNPNASAGSILKTLLNANGFHDENVLFFNKTFISTTSTSDLNKIINKKLIKYTIEFNAKVLNLLSEILEIPILILGGQNEPIFKKFFVSISKDTYLAPHTSMYKIFGNNKKIIGWDKKFEIFKNKYKNMDIFTDKGNVSYKKINDLDDKIGQAILKDYFNNVILN